MSLDLLVLGAYAYITLIMTSGVAGFLYLTSWLRDIMNNHIHTLNAKVEGHRIEDRAWFLRLESEIEQIKRHKK